jgi:hypothetical protein
MSTVSARRALERAVRRRRRTAAEREVPPVFWGRIGAYEAVCRQGVLMLLSPEPAHPSRRVTSPS